MLYKILKPLAIILLKLLFKFKVEGKNEIPSQGKFILASNHISYLDPIILGAAVPCRLFFLAKQELFKNKLFASFLKRLGAIPLQREKVKLSTLKSAIRILEENKPLVIFPQGKRDLYIDELKKGVGFLFHKTAAPLIIAKIEGSEKVLPPHKKFFRLHQISVKFARLNQLNQQEELENICRKISQRMKAL